VTELRGGDVKMDSRRGKKDRRDSHQVFSILWLGPVLEILEIADEFGLLKVLLGSEVV
jgi:hypothetical protein